MPILLCSDTDILLDRLRSLHDPEQPAVLLTGPNGDMAAILSPVLAGFLVVDVYGPHLSRLNFDAIALAVLDLPPDLLLSHAGRRLLDALGHLAEEEEFTLAFAGPATAVAGSLLGDGITAGLNLLPGTVVVPAVDDVTDLHMLLERISSAGVRLLAMDDSVAALYRHGDDTVAVGGTGNILLVAFTENREGRPTARLLNLTAGAHRGWPDSYDDNEA